MAVVFAWLILLTTVHQSFQGLVEKRQGFTNHMCRVEVVGEVIRDTPAHCPGGPEACDLGPLTHVRPDGTVVMVTFCDVSPSDLASAGKPFRKHAMIYRLYHRACKVVLPGGRVKKNSCPSSDVNCRQRHLMDANVTICSATGSDERRQHRRNKNVDETIVGSRKKLHQSKKITKLFKKHAKKMGIRSRTSKIGNTNDRTFKRRERFWWKRKNAQVAPSSTHLQEDVLESEHVNRHHNVDDVNHKHVNHKAVVIGHKANRHIVEQEVVLPSDAIDLGLENDVDDVQDELWSVDEHKDTKHHHRVRNEDGANNFDVDHKHSSKHHRVKN